MPGGAPQGHALLPWIPATLLLSATLIPAAPSIGLSPWLVGFVVLFVGNAWLLPRQCDYYRIVRDATKGQMLSQRQTALAGMIFTAGSIAGIAVSLPWWQAIGVM